MRLFQIQSNFDLPQGAKELEPVEVAARIQDAFPKAKIDWSKSLIMRDHFEFQELIAYLVACGLLLPIAGLVGRNSVWSVLVLLALFIPIPIYVARLRCGMPARIDTVFEKYAYIMLAVGLVSIVATMMIRALT